MHDPPATGLGSRTAALVRIYRRSMRKIGHFDLMEAWSAVMYELSEMLADARLFSHHRGSKLHNLTLEGTLLHARALIEFVVGRRDQKTGAMRRSKLDIDPGDFASDWNPDALPPPARDAVERLLVDLPLIDSTLSHLSWERADRGETDKVPWDFARIPSDIVTVFDAFAEHLDQQNLNARNFAFAYRFERDRLWS